VNVSTVLVVIPARNEEELIERCLHSVAQARAYAMASYPAVRIQTVVVADRCIDATVERVKQYPDVLIVEIDAGNVGRARGEGIRQALATLDHRSTWIANTDADSEVPANWIQFQLESAANGADVGLGTVRPRIADLTEHQVRDWFTRHVPGRPAGNIHGANLGIRASAYDVVGGFHALHEHEDVDLVQRLTGSGHRVITSDTGEVLTSGRLVGRTPGGFAAYLAQTRMTLEGA
jgi:glycosyltransferase involved in cell wall biosynthesis